MHGQSFLREEGEKKEQMQNQKQKKKKQRTAATKRGPTEKTRIIGDPGADAR